MYSQNQEESFSFPLPTVEANQYPPMPATDYDFSPHYRRGGSVSPRLGEMINHIQSQGEDEDQILAYINPEEAQELEEMFGSDINPYTGLPQYGKFWRKFRKIAGKALPVVGAVVGNYFAPGIGGMIGGAIGGGLSGAVGGSKHPLKTGLKGAAIGGSLGALQGYALPAVGRYLSASGSPALGGALTNIGKSQFGNLLGGTSLTGGGAGVGSIPLLPSAQLASVAPQAGSGIGNLLNYALLGTAALGLVGGKTKYKIPKEHRKEPSLQEMITSLRKANERPEDQPRHIAPYRAPEEYFEIPDVEEHGYRGYYNPYEGYAQGYAKGGEVRQRFMYGGQGRGRGRGGPQIPQGMDPRTAAILAHQQRNRELQERGRQQQLAQKGTVVPVPTPTPPNLTLVAASPDPRAAAVAEHQRYNQELQRAAQAKQAQEKAQEVAKRMKVSEVSPAENIASLEQALKALSERQSAGLLKEERDPLVGGLLNSPLFNMGGLLEDVVQYVPEEEFKSFKREAPEHAPREIKPYVAPPEHFEVPEVEEKGFQGYRRAKEGGMIEGKEGGQADNRPRTLKEGDYIVDATTVSLLGDGNTQAGKVFLDNFVNKFGNIKHKYAKGEKVSKIQVRDVPALVSDGEYHINRDIVSSVGRGDNNKGAAIIKKMINNIRRHKGIKGLPPKSKSMNFYLKSAA
jgi:hypothetical protein